jgi:exopolyphosphatase/guanosine-5'-triphosphate,3'-diphosphate pyrophosphatase
MNAEAEVVPRWEWRTFGDKFGAAESDLDASSPEAVEESDELYLLSAGDGDNVKVRDGRLEVKHLERVNDDGLEQWAPVMEAGFPLPASEVASVLEALGVSGPRLARATYTLDELVDEVVRPSPDLDALEIHKKRSRYTIDGCRAELTDVRTDRASTRTLAVESEEPDRVIATVRELGLDSRPNLSYPRALKELVGFGGGRYAVIDVGTSSVKFHIGERGADGRWRTIVDRSEVTRLGQGLDESGRLDPEAIERTAEAIAGMIEEAAQNGVVSIVAAGTAGLRIAPNANELIDAVRARSGVRIEVIPGEVEARLAYLAARSGLQLGTGSLVVFDTGGGSSQFTFGDGDRVDEQFSVNVGAARLTERFGLDGAVGEDVLAKALEEIAADLERLDGRPVPDTVVGMGGAVTNLAAVKHALASYDSDVVQGTRLDREEVDRQIELYRARGADERREIVGLQPKRAEIILAGACIVRTVLTKLGAEWLLVSDRGLRHGILVDRFGAPPAAGPAA